VKAAATSALFFVLFSAASVHAKPVYLGCRLYTGQDYYFISLALDEATQHVTLQMNGKTRLPDYAKFSEGAVTFATDKPPNENRWTVSRVDLSIQREFWPFQGNHHRGKCSLEKAPATRKF
jgi:hypothetical protein